MSKEYKQILESSEFLDKDESNRPIYIFGNPLYYYLSKKRQAIPEHGWTWEFYIEDQWSLLIPKLDKAKPIYIFIESYYADLIKNKKPLLYDFIGQYYIKFKQVDNGIWYCLKN